MCVIINIHTVYILYICIHIHMLGCDIYMNCRIHKDNGVISANSQDVGEFYELQMTKCSRAVCVASV